MSRWSNSGSWSALRLASRSSNAACTTANFSIALTPQDRVEPCVASPGTSSRKVNAPALAGTISPAVGSGITHASPRCPRRRVANAPTPPSSSPITVCTASGRRSVTPDRRSAATAPSIAATPPFMSQAPRACRTPSTTADPNGSLPGHRSQSPGGTTSTCPHRTSAGSVPSTPEVPTQPQASSRSTSIPGKSGSARSSARSNRQWSTAMSSSPSRPAHQCCTSCSASVPSTLGMRTSASRSATISAGFTSARTRASTSLLLRICRVCRRPQGEAQQTSPLGLRIDVTNIGEALDLLDGPSAR